MWPSLSQLSPYILSQSSLRRNTDVLAQSSCPDCLTRNQVCCLPDGALTPSFTITSIIVQRAPSGASGIYHNQRRRYDLVLGLNERYMPSSCSDLGHFNADESSSHHSHIPDLAVGDKFFRFTISVTFLTVNTLGPPRLYALWTDGTRPGEDQNIIPLS